MEYILFGAAVAAVTVFFAFCWIGMLIKVSKSFEGGDR
jgi:hypothetical protein